MSEADRLFEELGYEKREYGTDIWYWKDDYGICFSKAGERAYKNTPFTMEELKAINKKCLELRMDRGVINNVNRKRNRCHRLASGNGNVGCIISYTNDL